MGIFRAAFRVFFRSVFRAASGVTAGAAFRAVSGLSFAAFGTYLSTVLCINADLAFHVARRAAFGTAARAASAGCKRHSNRQKHSCHTRFAKSFLHKKPSFHPFTSYTVVCQNFPDHASS